MRAAMATDQAGRMIGIEMRETSGRIMGMVFLPTPRSPSTSWKSWAWMVVMITKKKMVSSGKFLQCNVSERDPDEVSHAESKRQ